MSHLPPLFFLLEVVAEAGDEGIGEDALGEFQAFDLDGGYHVELALQCAA